ncbi:alpha/beta fold hydrolase [Sphingomicrobium aestuariivivum]|uniref:alpha/beta fold hydrolase n=1 Tax=Sphingomicrobium aestuariivivum TaxID=1582356 RepID=UPI001FD6CDFC|nr:alpha/beta fold hydrolase [Sphingomicrobium aestuariivivum]MCJ8191246.1 alpha/beta hydrolase [Sphingomicrobium aestuariivivum]
MLGLTVAAMLAASEPVIFEEVTVPGPEGALSALLSDPAPDAPVVILIPGSGPTTRDGENPMLGGGGKIYAQLAEQLAARGVGMLRADKRGMFASAGAIADANKVTIADYAGDARQFVDLLVERDKPCAWLMGHSEGGLVALSTAQDAENICGTILLASMGRPAGVLLREQLGRALSDEQKVELDKVVAALEAGETPDPSGLPPQVAALFNPVIIDYLGDLVRSDPAALAAKTSKPMLIVHLEEDLQVLAADADALAAARPDATRIDFDAVNHVLKPVEPGNLSDNQLAYMDSERVIDPRIAEAIADFILAER